MKRLITGLGTVLLAVASATAQTPVPPLFTDAGAFAHQITIEHGISETRYRQVVSPVSLTIPVLMGSVSVRSAYMYLEERDSTGTRDTNGPLDAEISGRWTFGNVIFSGYTNVPTGEDSLAGIESSLSRVVARNDLDFPIKTFGRGLDYGGAITIARKLDHWAVSFGGGYVVRGAYSPLATVSDYDPGDELSITSGISYSTGGWTLGLDTAAKLIYVDRLGGAVLFRNGKQITARGSASYRSPKLRAEASITEIARLKNRIIAAGGLLYEDRDSNGNDVRARGKASLTLVEGVSVFAEAQLKDITANDYEPNDPLFMGAARLWSYGGGISVQLGETEKLTVRLLRGDGWISDRLEDVETLNVRVSVRLFF
jgi:hypothetical protein